MLVGGQTIPAAAPLEIIPVFVPAGSIVPMSPVMQYVDEMPAAPYEIRIYCGTDAEFYLYEDAGDSYCYENGAYSFIKLAWFEARNELVISARAGEFAGMVKSRQWRLIFISEEGRKETEVNYSGLELKLHPSGPNTATST